MSTVPRDRSTYTKNARSPRTSALFSADRCMARHRTAPYGRRGPFYHRMARHRTAPYGLRSPFNRSMARHRPAPYGRRGPFYHRMARHRTAPYELRAPRDRPTQTKTAATPRGHGRFLHREGQPSPYIYFACFFTAPNVVNCRFAAETGPRNIRVANVTGRPSNATSSI